MNDWFPNWSPDGKRLLFERMERRNGVHFSLYVIGADGRGLRRLSSVSAEIASAGHWGRWSPDGTRIAAVEEDSLLVMKPDGSGRNVLNSSAAPSLNVFPAGALWSPDGRELVFVTTHSDSERITVVKADGTDPDWWEAPGVAGESPPGHPTETRSPSKARRHAST